jgi:hypothetical protein
MGQPEPDGQDAESDDVRVRAFADDRDRINELRQGTERQPDVIHRLLEAYEGDGPSITDATVTIEAAEIRQMLREELDAMSVDVSVDLSDADLPSGGDVSEEDIRIWIRDEIEQNVVEQAREAL